MEYWREIGKISRFTLVEHVPMPGPMKPIRLPGLAYYLGRGWFLGFTTRQFRIDNGQRVEFGETGEYAVKVYFFMNREHVRSYFAWEPDHADLHGVGETLPFEVCEGVQLGDAFSKVSHLLRGQTQPTGIYYREGETRNMVSGQFVTIHRFITYGKIELLFYGSGAKARLSAFVFVLPEAGV